MCNFLFIFQLSFSQHNFISFTSLQLSINSISSNLFFISFLSPFYLFFFFISFYVNYLSITPFHLASLPINLTYNIYLILLLYLSVIFLSVRMRLCVCVCVGGETGAVADGDTQIHTARYVQQQWCCAGRSEAESNRDKAPLRINYSDRLICGDERTNYFTLCPPRLRSSFSSFSSPSSFPSSLLLFPSPCFILFYQFFSPYSYTILVFLLSFYSSFSWVSNRKITIMIKAQQQQQQQQLASQAAYTRG